MHIDFTLLLAHELYMTLHYYGPTKYTFCNMHVQTTTTKVQHAVEKINHACTNNKLTPPQKNKHPPTPKKKLCSEPLCSPIFFFCPKRWYVTMETFESVKVSEKFSGANSEQETPQFLLKVVVPFDRFF